jgi:hypothetical protein
MNPPLTITKIARLGIVPTIAISTILAMAQGPGRLIDQLEQWEMSPKMRTLYYNWVNPGFRRPVREWQTPAEWLWPSLTLEEANSMVGRHVICAYRSSATSGGCNAGDRGEVVDIEKIDDNSGYFVVVQWDGHDPLNPCYYGRFSSRLFLISG